MAEVEDLRAAEITISAGSVRTLAFSQQEQITMLAGFGRDPWVACLHMNGRVVVRDATLAEVRSLASGGTAIHVLVTPDDADLVAGTKNFRSWSTNTWKSGAFSWKSGFSFDSGLVALGPDARHAVIATSAELRIFDAASGDRLASHAGIFGAKAIIVGERLFVESAGAIQVRALPGGELEDTLAPFAASTGNALLARVPGTSRLVIGDRELRSVEIDAASLTTLAHADDAAGLETPELARGAWSSWDRVYTPDGATSVSSYGTHRWGGADLAMAWVVVRDTASGGELARMTIPFTSTNPRALAITPDGNTVFFALGPFYQVGSLVAWSWR